MLTGGCLAVAYTSPLLGVSSLGLGAAVDLASFPHGRCCSHRSAVGVGATPPGVREQPWGPALGGGSSGVHTSVGGHVLRCSSVPPLRLVVFPHRLHTVTKAVAQWPSLAPRCHDSVKTCQLGCDPADARLRPA